MIFVYCLFVIWTLELAYFALARRLGILDHPNNRSLHEVLTIRGGGIIFILSPILNFILFGNSGPWFVAGTVLVGLVGLSDDIKHVSPGARYLVQSLAFLLVFNELHLYHFPWWILIVVFILVTGAINAFNFMDGINGITGGYSLVVLCSLWYVNEEVHHFISSDFLILTGLALLVFNYYNFRTKAICFAGDAGSLTIGFIIIYLIIKLVMSTHNFLYVLLVAVYGVDSILTIIHRMYLRENIFKPHLRHLFQVIVAKAGWPHLKTAGVYMAIQSLVSAIVFLAGPLPVSNQLIPGLVILLTLSVAYYVAKQRLGGFRRDEKIKLPLF